MSETTTTRPVTEAERMTVQQQLEVITVYLQAATRPEAKPDVVGQTVGQAVHSVAALISSLHQSAAELFHAELAVAASPDDCPVCQLADRLRRRDRLYPGRLNQVEAELFNQPGRPLGRDYLLEILVEVDAVLDKYAEPDVYASAREVERVLSERYYAPPSLADVARVIRALRTVRGL